MWAELDHRLALLELLTTGSLKRRRAQTAAFDALADLSWTRASGRRDTLVLVEARRDELVQLLTRVWPEWVDAWGDLTARGCAPTPEGWVRAADARRAESVTALPQRINRKTAASYAAPHSKARLTPRRRAALGASETMHDGTVRLRPPPGLVVRSNAGELALDPVVALLGEVAIAERAFRDELSFEGPIEAVLLVENLGAWRDLPQLEGWLYAHVPGWDTATIGHLLARVRHVPVVHFGDLDPNGIRIYRHLRERRPELSLLAPEFWSELVDAHGQRGRWPSELELDDLPPLVRELARRRRWLEQERIVLDPRLLEALSRISRSR